MQDGLNYQLLLFIFGLFIDVRRRRKNVCDECPQTTEPLLHDAASAVLRCRLRRTCTISVRIDSAISSGVMAPMS